jgi:hypothetical protein
LLEKRLRKFYCSLHKNIVPCQVQFTPSIRALEQMKGRGLTGTNVPAVFWPTVFRTSDMRGKRAEQVRSVSRVWDCASSPIAQRGTSREASVEPTPLGPSASIVPDQLPEKSAAPSGRYNVRASAVSSPELNAAEKRQ